ncbi:MAG: S-ribosylhomocysteine lyase [Clostridia bacterium]|nr:S-ribosylhomocysteine lyase [Clostridia bacterium]MDY5555951.1 S-ribosylhomocysteine lyase [Blautia sp.]
MQRIPSFSIDHTKLKRGVYLSRQDDDIMTWDIRIKEPNHGDYLTTGVSHTIEHLFATYARNSKYKDGVIYVGPMGCRTGCYFLTRGLSNEEVLDCIRESFRFITTFEGEIPGAKEEECGNYRDHDLEGCRVEAAKYLEVLDKLTPEDMHYTYYLD